MPVPKCAHRVGKKSPLRLVETSRVRWNDHRAEVTQNDVQRGEGPNSFDEFELRASLRKSFGLSQADS